MLKKCLGMTRNAREIRNMYDHIYDHCLQGMMAKPLKACPRPSPSFGEWVSDDQTSAGLPGNQIVGQTSRFLRLRNQTSVSDGAIRRYSRQRRPSKKTKRTGSCAVHFWVR